MFATTELAERIERAEVRLSTAVAEGAASAGIPNVHVVRVGSGVAVYGGQHSPVNKMIGVGFDGVPSDESLAEAEAVFANRDTALQAEVSTLVNPEVLRRLCDRGYRLEGFENVLGLGLRSGDVSWDDQGYLRVTTIEDRDAPAWMAAVVEGFAHPDDVPAAPEPQAVDTLGEVFRTFYAAEGFRRYAAWWDGQLAGGGTLRMENGIAQLCGAATLPAYRRRGIQTALLNARLADAASAGCDLATVTTAPGSKSQQNAQRRGFALLYARALLVKRP